MGYDRIQEIEDKINKLDSLHGLISSVPGGGERSFRAGDFVCEVLKDCESAQVLCCECLAGERMARHFHRDSVEVLIVLSGALRVTKYFDGGECEEVDLVPAELVHIRAGVEHSMEAMVDSRVLAVVIPAEQEYSLGALRKLRDIDSKGYVLF